MQPKLVLGGVIADRTYQWQRGKSRGDLTVRIGAPGRDPRPGGDWLCPVQFSGMPRGQGIPTGVVQIFGVDSVQALTLALGFVQTILAHSASRLSITWLDSTDLGLPDINGLIGVRRSFRRPPRRKYARADK